MLTFVRSLPLSTTTLGCIGIHLKHQTSVFRRASLENILVLWGICIGYGALERLMLLELRDGSGHIC
jgi:hypothetical protein